MHYLIVLLLSSSFLCANQQSSFFIEGGALYWKAKEGSLEIPVQTEQSVGSQIQELNFQWDPGFIVNGGFRSNDWALALIGTVFDSEAHAILEDEGVYPENELSLAKGFWDLDYRTIDLLFSNDFRLHRHFSIVALLGTRFCYLHQDLRIDYLNDFELSFTGKESSSMRAKNNYTGGGLLLGATFQFGLNQTIQFFGEFLGNINYGSFNLSQKTRYLISESTVDLSVSETINRLRSSLQESLGVQLILDMKMKFLFSLSFQASQWFRQNLLSRVVDYTDDVMKQGDLDLYGLTVTTSCEF